MSALHRPPRTVAVAVVGGGFSGVALTCALMRQARQPLQVTLVERRAALGCGVAYGTGQMSHLLNVPAGRMGVDAQDETGFARHLVSQGQQARAQDFVPRALYASYLKHALVQAARNAASGVGWAWRHDQALSCDSRSVTFQRSAVLRVDAVVLTTGHLPPSPPHLADGPNWTEPGLVPDPWQPGALDAMASDAPVLLLGTGLTALDMLLQLRASGHAGRITLASRRGLLPQPHRRLESPPPSGLVPPDALSGLDNARAMLRAVRQLVSDIESRGHDWRDAVAGLRPATPRLWRQLALSERRRFLRHLQPFWDTHRHRSAPQARAALDALAASGQVQVRAARLRSLRPAADGGWHVGLQARGSDLVDTLAVGWVVNCTGPSSHASQTDDPLLRHLIADGAAVPDPLGLGLCVETDYRLAGAPENVGGLRYLGPLLKAGWWEAVAVPELRVHADKLAGMLVSELGLG